MGPEAKDAEAARAKLLEGIAKARLWTDELVSGAVSDTRTIAEREGCSERSVRLTLNLAFLAPKIVQAAVAGTLPRGTGVSGLMDLAPDWEAQWRAVQNGGMTAS